MKGATTLRKTLGATLALLPVAGGASPARASLWTGARALHPADATKTLGCGVSSIQSVTMVGVLAFQDP